MTAVLIWRGEDTEEKGRVKTEAKAGVIRPQAEVCWQLLEVGGRPANSPSELPEGISAADSLRPSLQIWERIHFYCLKDPISILVIHCSSPRKVTHSDCSPVLEG